MRYVVKLSYFDPADTTVKTAYFGTTAFTTKPTDTPAHTVVEPRVVTPAFVRRDVFDTGMVGGASRVGFGELVLANSDGALDDYAGYGLDGRDCEIRVGEASAAYPAGYTLLFAGTMEQIEVGPDQIQIRLRDRQVFTTNDLQKNLYGGTNVLPNGVDGIESDLKGKPKPILYGTCFNLEPVCVNTTRLVYQVNDGAIRDIMAVYDSGALLRRGDDYADQTAMLATAPAAGTYRVWKAGGMFRVGGAPSGLLTCDAVEGLWPANRTAAQIFSRVLTERAERDPSEISATDITALDTANSATIGVYFRDAITVSAALDQITQSVGAWWATDAAGLIRIKRLEAPSGAAVMSLTPDNTANLKRVPLSDGGLPVYRVTVRCVPNLTVQTSDLLGTVSAARRARLAQPFQDGIAEDATIRTAFLLAPELTIETRLACRAQGDAEATRLLNLFKVKRDRFEVTLYTNGLSELATIDLGAVVRLTYPRYGLDSGKLFRVLGYQLDAVQNTVSLTLWG